MKPRQPPQKLAPCPVCREPCLGHVLTGVCAACTGREARIALLLRKSPSEAAK
jgi:hypothetical protein